MKQLHFLVLSLGLGFLFSLVGCEKPAISDLTGRYVASCSTIVTISSSGEVFASSDDSKTFTIRKGDKRGEILFQKGNGRVYPRVLEEDGPDLLVYEANNGGVEYTIITFNTAGEEPILSYRYIDKSSYILHGNGSAEYTTSSTICMNGTRVP